MTPSSQRGIPTDALSPSSSRGADNWLGHGYNNTEDKDLAPEPYDKTQKRKLLLVYLHGFMGNDDSFQRFPYHLHKILTRALNDSHAVHTKIYPKYKTYKAIEVARDNFSRWLQPHESPTTDVILLGHSMGGLLAAEVVLMPTRNASDLKVFQHRILGTVNLDVPLLGLHPGIITSGIASLFRKKPDPPKSFNDTGQPQATQVQSTPPSSDTVAFDATGQPRPGAGDGIMRPGGPAPMQGPQHNLDLRRPTMDPNFNQPFPNDVRLKDRGWWKNVVHFVTKHNSEGLLDAATNHIMSHMEFGSCLMDFNGLKLRYDTLRKLEDINDIKYHGMPHVPDRVRFVQYYTVCHGYPKKPKSPKPKEPEDSRTSHDYLRAGGSNSSEPSSPSISIENYDSMKAPKRTSKLAKIPKEDTLTEQRSSEAVGDNASVLSQQLGSDVFHTPETSRPGSVAAGDTDDPPDADPPGVLSAIPVLQKPTEDNASESTAELANTSQSGKSQELQHEGSSVDIEWALEEFERSLPPLPEVPSEPEWVTNYDESNKEVRKYAEKENKRREKDFEKAKKSWHAAEKARTKAIKKMRGKLEAQHKESKGKAKKAAKDATAVQQDSHEKLVFDRDEAAAAQMAFVENSVALADHATSVGHEKDERRGSMQILEPLPITEDEIRAYNPTRRESLKKAGEDALVGALRQLSTDYSDTRKETDEISKPTRTAPPVPNNSHQAHNSTMDKGKGKEGAEHLTGHSLSAQSLSSTLQAVNSNDSTARSPLTEVKSENLKDPAHSSKPEKPSKPPKNRKFCNTPSKVDGKVDSKWISIFMKDVDEVAAHTGLFFPGPHYDKLLGDVEDMIVDWVQHDATRRLINGEA